MSTTASALMTVEEYLRVPDPPGGRYELHAGVLVKVPFPNTRHNEIEFRLAGFFLQGFGAFGKARTEFPFRPLPEHELRSADVAFVSHDRWDATNELGYLSGAPDMVIEVLSPSNTSSEMDEKSALCLANGTAAFWTVNPMRRTVTIRHRDSRIEQYTEADTIDIHMFGVTAKLPVRDIFDGL